MSLYTEVLNTKCHECGYCQAKCVCLMQKGVAVKAITVCPKCEDTYTMIEPWGDMKLLPTTSR